MVAKEIWGFVGLNLLATVLQVATVSFALAAKFRDAHRYLRTEIYRYRAGLIGLPDLIDAYSHAEKLVGHMEIDALSDRSSSVPGQAGSTDTAHPDPERMHHPLPGPEATGYAAADEANPPP